MSARCMRSASSRAAATSGTSEHTTRNSSPPIRATLSSGRALSASRRAVDSSSRSPIECPSASLTYLSRSTSMKIAATWPGRDRSAAIAAASTDMIWRRFANPVSASWFASWRRRVVSVRARVTSWAISPTNPPPSIASSRRAAMVARNTRETPARSVWSTSPCQVPSWPPVTRWRGAWSRIERSIPCPDAPGCRSAADSAPSSLSAESLAARTRPSNPRTTTDV